MSSKASSIIPADDRQAVLAALRLLGVKVRSEAWKDGEMVEVWASNPADPDEIGGLKFTFKHGSLTELHIRALPLHDVRLVVTGSPPTFKGSDGARTLLQVVGSVNVSRRAR